MKRLYVLLALCALLFAALACNLPWESPPDTPETPLPTDTEEAAIVEPTPEEPIEDPTDEPYTCAPDMVPATALSVEFCYPAGVSSGISHRIEPEKLPSFEGEPWDFNPDTLFIDLLNYPVNGMYQDAQIIIYPIEDYIEIGPSVATTITELEILLIAQPPEPDFVPFLPVYNAAQMMQGNVKYLDFRNGYGVRFITQYGQAASPITNDTAVYHFMGLTEDGLYAISATFPINHDLFYPDILTEPGEGWMAFAEGFDVYIQNMESELGMQYPESFIPNLRLLDEMMTSLLIPADAIP